MGQGIEDKNQNRVSKIFTSKRNPNESFGDVHGIAELAPFSKAPLKSLFPN